MYGEQQQQSGYRNGSTRGAAASTSNGKASSPNIPQRRSGATNKQPPSAPQMNNSSASNSNGNGNGTAASAVSGVAAASPAGGAAASASPTNSAPFIPLAAPRSQQLGSPRSPADYQSSPTSAGSPQGSPGSRGIYGSAFSPTSGYVKGAELVQRSGLERLIADEELTRTNVPLSELRTLPGTNKVKVGYDGSAILRTVTEAVQDQDPLATFTSTTPVVVMRQYTIISDEVCAVAAAVTAPASPGASPTPEFEPVFIFDGMPLSPFVDPPNALPLKPPAELAPFNGQTPMHAAKSLTYNIKQLVAGRFRVDEDLEACFIRTMRTYFSEVFRAPYGAWAQLSALFSPTNRYISEVYGSLELLAFPGIDRVITKFDSVAKTFDYVDKQTVLNAINRKLSGTALTERDLGCLIMADTQQKPYRLSFAADLGFNELISRMGASEPLPDDRGRGYNFSKMFPPAEKRQLNVNFCLLDAPVLTNDAAVLPLYTVYGVAPHSSLRARETFGAPLPPVLYVCLFSGLVMPSTLASVSLGMLVDRWPLIDSPDYRKLLNFIAPIRSQTAVHLLNVARSLHPPSRWYRQYVRASVADEGRLIPLNAPAPVTLNEWRLADNPILRDSGEPYFLTVLPLYTTTMLTMAEPPAQPYYNGVKETTASVLLKTLDQLGYFTHTVEESNTGVSVAISTEPSYCALALRNFDCDTLSEYGLLCIELLRTSVLHDQPIQLVPDTRRQYQRNAKPGVRFASRLLSIIPINTSETWGGPFDPEIAAFGAVARALSRNIRQLSEGIATSTFCTNRTDMPIEEMFEVVSRLPMSLPTEFVAGHLMNFLLYNEECTMEELCQYFPECYVLSEDLDTLFWFWAKTIPAICTLSHDISIDLQMVRQANEVVTQAGMRLDPERFGYLQYNRDMLEKSINATAPPRIYSQEYINGDMGVQM